MLKNLLVALSAFVLVGACVFGAGTLMESESAISTLTEESPCPAVGCASGQCHGFDDVPEPDGIHQMDCPEASCSSVECHAWDSLLGRYHQASDASLNLWLLAPVALIVILMGLVRTFSRSEGNAGEQRSPGGSIREDAACDGGEGDVR